MDRHTDSRQGYGISLALTDDDDDNDKANRLHYKHTARTSAGWLDRPELGEGVKLPPLALRAARRPASLARRLGRLEHTPSPAWWTLLLLLGGRRVRMRLHLW